MTRRNFETLTPREKEVLEGLIEHYSHQKVAQVLRLSPKTISTYLERAKEKLYCDSTLEVVLRYDRWRWQQERSESTHGPINVRIVPQGEHI